ncbi:MAG: serine/threonine-protein kinase [Solirubrobacteraceae bacterium]
MDSADTLIGGSIRVSDERSRRRGERLLGRYRLVRQLGAGGFGVVWHAHDEQLDRPVALKRIPLPGEEDRERATREALATARLSHPAIVALYEARADGDAFYLISELVQGDTLALLIAEDELADEEVLEIGVALCDALAHAHARGVVHRDVKPHNVLVPHEENSSRDSAAPTPKLADFGGATLAGDESLTRSGDVFGTLAYMAPEQSDGEDAGPEADLYSLALVLYEALSGVNPVRGRTPAATARRIGSPIEPLERRRRDLPRELTRALDTAMAAEPHRRGTLEDLRRSLTGALQRGSKRSRFGRSRARRAARDGAPEWIPSDRGTRTTVQRGFGGESDSDVSDRARPGTGTDVAPIPKRVARTPTPGVPVDESEPQERSRGRIFLPRLLWLGCVLALAVWQAAQGLIGVSLLVLVAGAPLLLLPRRAGPGLLAAALAPVLGLAGLAGAFPALAGQRTTWRSRAALAVLGFWWLALAEPLLARHLWLGPPAGLPPRAVWEASFDTTSKEVVGPTLTVELAIGALVWAVAAAVLPWIVRGRNAALDVVAAVAWTVTLLAAVPLLESVLLVHSNEPSPRGALLGAVLGCAIAICARALRGPT